MQKINKKLSLPIIFFKIAGIDLEKIQLKRLQILQYFPYFAYSFQVITTVILSTWIIYSLINDAELTMKKNSAGILVLISLSISAVNSLFFTLKNRQMKRKFWNLVDQLDDFILRFLGIKIDYERENWFHLRKIFINIAINMGNSIVIRNVIFSNSQNFNRYLPRVIYFIFVNQLVTNKFIFYVSILYSRFKIITENLNQIRSYDYKVYTLQRAHFIIWKLSKKIEKMFGWTMVLIIINVYTIAMFYTFLSANDLSVNNFRFMHMYTEFAPLINIGILCYNCERFRRTVSKVSALVIKNNCELIFNVRLKEKSSVNLSA